MSDPKSLAWILKYEPHTLEQYIGHEDLVASFKQYVALHQIPNMTLGGSPGVGKTLLVKCFAHDLGLLEWDELNIGNWYPSGAGTFQFLDASNERGIDMVRTTLRGLAEDPTLDNEVRLICLDEGDNMCLNPNTEIIVDYNEKTCFKPLSSLPQENIPLYSLNLKTLKIERDIGKIVNSGSAELYRITFDDGSIIEASANHPFFMIENNILNIIKTNELQIGTELTSFKEEFGINHCEICNKNTIKQKRFCSKQCVNKGHSKDMTGINNPRHGTSGWNLGLTKEIDSRIKGAVGDRNASKRPEVNAKRSISLLKYNSSEVGKATNIQKGIKLSKTKKGKSLEELYPNTSVEERRKSFSSTYKSTGIFIDSNYRRYLKDLENIDCEICKESICVGGRSGIYVHHKDENHNNNERINLMFVCPKCHNIELHNVKDRFLKKGWNILRGNKQ